MRFSFPTFARPLGVYCSDTGRTFRISATGLCTAEIDCSSPPDIDYYGDLYFRKVSVKNLFGEPIADYNAEICVRNAETQFGKVLVGKWKGNAIYCTPPEIKFNFSEKLYFLIKDACDRLSNLLNASVGFDIGRLEAVIDRGSHMWIMFELRSDYKPFKQTFIPEILQIYHNGELGLYVTRVGERVNSDFPSANLGDFRIYSANINYDMLRTCESKKISGLLERGLLEALLPMVGTNRDYKIFESGRYGAEAVIYARKHITKSDGTNWKLKSIVSAHGFKMIQGGLYTDSGFPTRSLTVFRNFGSENRFAKGGNGREFRKVGPVSIYSNRKYSSMNLKKATEAEVISCVEHKFVGKLVVLQGFGINVNRGICSIEFEPYSDFSREIDNPTELVKRFFKEVLVYTSIEPYELDIREVFKFIENNKAVMLTSEKGNEKLVWLNSEVSEVIRDFNSNAPDMVSRNQLEELFYSTKLYESIKS